MPIFSEAFARLFSAPGDSRSERRPESWLARGDTRSARRPPRTEQKASRVGPLIAYESPGAPVWSPRDYGAFAREGFMQNAIVYRSVRMVAEAAASIPLLLYEGGVEIESHPLLDLIRRPSLDHTGTDFLEAWYGFLLVAGNAYVEAVSVDGEIRELHNLRPDRMKVLPGLDGWPEGYEYTAGGKSVRFIDEAVPGVRPILHTRLFHPANDHYGMSPIEAAAVAIDIHNTASSWNKALLDNSARPSGALVYSASNGQMTQDQFARLKSELETSFQGAAHAGRPLLLEGGLDWKPLSMTPKDMDFIEAKNSAAREIALAIGVPPMLLGIPGDATYSNYAEAQRALWRNTVLPVVNRMAKGFSNWLSPAFGAELELKPDLDQVEALAPEREALWTRLEAASFLTDDEKRAAAGYGAKDSSALAPSDSPLSSRPLGAGPAAKFNPYHDSAGRFTTADGVVTGPGHTLGGAGKPGARNNDGSVRVANAEAENLRARIGGNGPPVESGTFLGRAGVALGRYVFGPLGALISMTEPLGNGEVVAPYAGKKSTGILETTEGDFYLISGKKGPASSMPPKSSGFNGYTKTHVEGHAAALMHQLGLTEARVYVNNPKICGSCTRYLPRMLPPGSKLEVITPIGSQTFAGKIIP